jgi:predicted nucleic acid-binding protein
MNFAQIPAGASLFIDANTFIYHFSGHGNYGQACTNLLDRVEHQEILAYATAHVLSDVAHRLMTIEAMNLLGWPSTRLAARLKQHHGEIPKLGLFRLALLRITQVGVRVIPVTEPLVLTATALCQQHELLTGDASIVAAMQQEGLTMLASEDSDFDRVPGLTRYGPA